MPKTERHRCEKCGFVTEHIWSGGKWRCTWCDEKQMVVYLAYRDEQDEMIPVAHGGMLTVFTDPDRANAAKGGLLGVWVPTV